VQNAVRRYSIVPVSFAVFGFLLVISASGLLALGLFQPLLLVTALVLTIAAIGVAAKSERRTLQLLMILSAAYALSSALWPRYVALFLPGLPSLNPTRILNVLVVMLLLAAAISSTQLRLWWRQSFAENKGVWFFLFAMCAFRIASIAVSDEPTHSAYTYMNELFVHVLMFFVGIAWVQYDPKLRRMGIVACFSFLVVAILGMVEWRLGKPLFGQFVDPTNAYVQWAASGKIRDGIYRAQSTLGYPIAFAEFAVISAGIALAFCVSSGRWWIRAVSVIALPVLLAGAVFSSGSRSGYIAGAGVMLGVFVAFVTLDMLNRRVSLGKAFLWSMLSAVVAAIFAVVLYVAFDRAFGSGADRGSDSYRVTMHQRAAVLASESPLIGYGVGRAAYKVKVVTPGVPSQYTIDSYFVSLLVDSGIPALVSFLGAVLFAVRSGFSKSMSRSGPEGLRWAALSIVLLGALLFKSIISIYDNNLFIFVIMGCLVASAGEAKIRTRF
jgi:O-antigen ligase